MYQSFLRECDFVVHQEDAAITNLHQSFHSRIYYFALRELGSPAVAEDVCNETLLRVIQAIRAGKVNDGALPGYVAGTTRNVIFEQRRLMNRAGSIDGDDYHHHAEPPDPSIRRTMELVLSRMKARERDVLRLLYFEEQTKEEIGQQLGIDPERVRLVKSRALKSFREFYNRLTQMPKK